LELAFLKEIKRKCLLTWCICIFLLVVSWQLNALAFIDTPNWFSRSGSLVAITAALSEWWLLNRIEMHHKWVHQCSIIPKQSPYRLEAEQIGTETYIEPVEKIANVSNVILIVLGTIVWGYGDILYKHING
jgi:hypothetical protein